jgi:hypothetical protein
MWEPSLNAYTYDTPKEPANRMYTWMERTKSDDWNWDPSQSEDILLEAIQIGVNRIILPENVGDNTIKNVQETLSNPSESLDPIVTTLTQAEGYYIIIIS